MLRIRRFLKAGKTSEIYSDAKPYPPANLQENISASSIFFEFF